MTIFRITLIAAAALGVTWAAEQAVRSAASERVPVMAQVDATPAAETPVEEAEQPDSEAVAQPGIPELSAEEMEAELARIEAAVAGAENEELEEFTPTKPLAADLAIAWPSDI